MWTCLDVIMTCLLLAPSGTVDDVATPPPTSEFVVVPLRVHILTADGLPEVDCKLTDDDIRRIIGKVNLVSGRVVAAGDTGAQVEVLGRRVAARDLPAGARVGDAVRIVLRPEAIDLQAIERADDKPGGEPGLKP